ncbi:MAG: PAS domain S-box protein [Bacteroidales bacterium]
MNKEQNQVPKKPGHVSSAVNNGRHKLEFLRNTAVELVDLPFDRNLYAYAAEKLHEVIPDSYVLVSRKDDENKQILFEGIAGSRKTINKAFGILDKYSDKLPQSAYKHYENIKRGHLFKLPNDLYELSDKRIPEALFRKVEKLIRIKAIYSIGITRKGKLFGSVVILMTKDVEIDKDLIEAFVHQLSIALNKKFTEIDLQQSEELFSKAFHSSPDAININRVHDGKFLSINKGFTEMSGYTAEDVVGKTSAEINLWKDMADRERLTKELFRHGHVKNLEADFRMKDGTIRSALMTANLITIKGTKYILSITRDISERKKHLEQLKIQRKYFQDLFQYSPDAIVILDEKDRVKEINENFTRLFGYSEKEATGKPINELIAPDELKSEAMEATIKVSKGDYVDFETIRQDKHKKRKYVSVRGKPIIHADNQLAVYGIYKDITDKKRSEISLKLSEERYRIVGKQTGQVIYDYDLRTGKIDWAGAIEEVLGYPVNEFQHVDVDGWKQLIHPEERKSIIKQLDAAKEKAERFSFEYRIRKNDGSYIYVEENGIFQCSDQKVPYRLMGSIKDITERKEQLLQLERAREKAEEADKLKTAFLANMSHEIRTPMNAIIGFSSLLAENDVSEESRREYIRIISNSSTNLLHIIDDILDISMIETGQITVYKKEFSVSKILHELYNIHNEYRKLSNKEPLEFSLADIPEKSHDLLISDPEKIKQILSNLLNNALKFTEKGFVRFGCHFVNETPNPVMKFYVEDSGIGIAREKQKIIFERFQQIDISNTREKGGTGLGLSISKHIANLLEGKLTLVSSPGEGSTFYLTIPYIPGVQNIKAPEGPEGTKTFEPNYKILVAEDVESNYLLIENILKRENINTLHASNGLEVLELYREHPDIDLIIMDLRMPEMNGYEALRELIKAGSDVPVIALTAYALKEDIEKSRQYGFSAYLTKPIKPSLLLETLHSFLKK